MNSRHLLLEFSEGSNAILSNIEWTQTTFFVYRTYSNVFIYLWSNSNTLFLDLNKQTTNIEPSRTFSRFTKSLIELTLTSFFKHGMNSNLFIYWWLNWNTLFLASNDQTSNFEYCSTHRYYNFLNWILWCMWGLSLLH